MQSKCAVKTIRNSTCPKVFPVNLETQRDVLDSKRCTSPKPVLERPGEVKASLAVFLGEPGGFQEGDLTLGVQVPLVPAQDDHDALAR